MSLRIRDAVRALLVTPGAEVLLVRFEFPDTTVWALPGGGLEPGEDHEAALHRELAEEVGLHDVVLGPHVWNREHIIPFVDGRWDGQRDRVYLIETERFDPRPELSWDQLRAEHLHELRWWHVDDLLACPPAAGPGDERAASSTLFAPRTLPSLVRSLLADGPPPIPVDTGV